jgi:hypothetical protein
MGFTALLAQNTTEKHGKQQNARRAVKEKRVGLHKAISGRVHMVGAADKANIIGATAEIQRSVESRCDAVV